MSILFLNWNVDIIFTTIFRANETHQIWRSWNHYRSWKGLCNINQSSFLYFGLLKNNTPTKYVFGSSLCRSFDWKHDFEDRHLWTKSFILNTSNVHMFKFQINGFCRWTNSDWLKQSCKRFFLNRLWVASAKRNKTEI